MMKEKNKNFDLEERLITFSIKILNIGEQLPNTRTGNYISGQIIRSGSAPALIYGEAQSAESRKDFIHKMKIALKELRETNIALKIIRKKPLIQFKQEVDLLLNECNELLSIFVSSIKTASNNLK
jgi:four helix bundle protein